MKHIIGKITLLAGLMAQTVMVSCGGHSYRELPFGGMNGRVQKVTVWHLRPEMWQGASKKTDVMYMNASVYDINGNEICSAVMDSAGRIQAEAESLFEDGVCVRSTQKAGNKVIVQINLRSKNRNVTEYDKRMGTETTRMIVKETSRLGRKYKSTVTENGLVTTISEIRTDREGYPVKITVTNPQTGFKSVETNIFDERHNVTEKHVESTDEDNPEETTYTDYGGFDEHGNWTEARTYNGRRLPAEVLIREIEYW